MLKSFNMERTIQMNLISSLVHLVKLNQYVSDFKLHTSFEQRINETSRVKRKYPVRVPIICEPLHTSIDRLHHVKYLVSNDVTVGQLIYIIRTRLKLDSTVALYILINNTVPKTSDTIRSLYEMYKSDDGFMYVQYDKESVYG